MGRIGPVRAMVAAACVAVGWGAGWAGAGERPDSIDPQTWWAQEACVPTASGVPPVSAADPFPWGRRRGRRGVTPATVTFVNVHTKEVLAVYDGLGPTQKQWNRFLRSRGFGRTTAMDPRVIDGVLAAAVHFGARRVLVFSGYRSEKFNDALRKKGRHVAVRSQHALGRAVDFRLVGHPARAVGAWLRSWFPGGVGIYADDNFVHLDTGPKRTWRGK